MISTYSKFFYNLEVTSDNKYLDIDEGDGEISITIPTGLYTPTDLAEAIQTELNDALVNTYAVAFNRSTRIFSITSNNAIDLLVDSGAMASAGIYDLIGIDDSTDFTADTTITGTTAVCSIYEPQFWLQDYISEADFRRLRMKTKSESASGLVQVQSFGTDRFFEFSIKFATNITQPSNGPVLHNSSGVDDLRDFMRYATKKGGLEFMPDKNDASTFFKLVLESTPDDSDGTGYKLQEQYSRGFVGYFETGILKFRVME